MNKAVSSPWCFIINPHAGGGRAARQWPDLYQRLKSHSVTFEHAITTSSSQARALACSRANAGIRNFIAVGGDGTVNDILQGVFQSKLPLNNVTLSVVPWGTGNDWARFHHIPHSPNKWLSFFLNASQAPHDVGIAQYGKAYASHHAFLNIAGTGLDSHIIQQMGAAGGKSLRYYLTLFKSLYRYTANTMTLTLAPLTGGDGHAASKITKRHKALITMVCIGQYGGSGMRFAPMANSHDGLLDVLSITDIPFWHRIISTPYLLNGKINQHPAAFYQQTPSVAVSDSTNEYFQCDGEIIDKLPVRFCIHPQQINTLISSR
ncbi:hypothetical protein ABT56_12475 [Photobacterium aquae]|uniref:DAGKc domain-containing protein n=1 Tax=Photobacterium aquae TaxID=1195763 RepID=A0A0J1JSF8_9GAMM|nr:hypothetical protein ABT56_12475 [Photobacterium aquae]